MMPYTKLKKPAAIMSDRSKLSSSTITPDIIKNIPNVIAKKLSKFEELFFVAIILPLMLILLNCSIFMVSKHNNGVILM